MLSRVALRTARLSKPTAAAFHTGAFRQQEEKKDGEVAIPADNRSFLNKYGLDDPLISLPIIAAVSIPAISNGWYELGAETQLACCFALFVTSAYKYGGGAIGSYFESRADAILAEQNAVEDANLALAKETLKAHESILTIKKDIATLGVAHEEALALLCQVQNAKLRHKTRDTFVKNLDAIYQLEQSYNQELQNAMIASATAAVRKTISAGKKETKAEAFQLALDILSEKNIDESKPDAVAAAFGKELRAFAEHLEAQQGTVVKLTEAEQKELEAGLDAFFKKIDIHAGELKTPTEVKVELL
ncbi:hypothetical protein H257_03641 [Aphanomyces astaci]|uniref:ATP synthase subunit b n=1 Tax=Aphanomyces astaci TaxID=112090 RepID=W4GXH5_APHAT|nr:hypothetical protein H257_03641 [Aphanomyces astaci]ETV84430.1 hypothetical protein H257_03641 [Aphanomyces astaci]|eukprot:XP_009826122.1 hypothetical protein H257_03641 [Aphanomyces astaci]